MKEYEQIVSIAYLVVLCSLALLILGRYLYFRKTKLSRILLRQEHRVYQFFRWANILILPYFLAGMVNFLFILQKGNLFAPYWGKALLILGLLLLLCTEIRYNLLLRPRLLNRLFNIVFTFLLVILGSLFHVSYFRAIEYPDLAASVVIGLPFEGRWIASGAGATGLTNHHDRIPSQKYAIDFARLGENGKLFKGEGVKNEDSYTFGALVISPVNGTVVFALDSLPDVKITERDKLAGNHLIIQFQDTLFVALAHLKQYSILVQPGDRVAEGQALAQVGNSGNTDFSHLHIHVMDSPEYDIERSRSYPFRFRSFQRMRYLFWHTQNNGYLLSNDIIKPLEHQTHKH